MPLYEVGRLVRIRKLELGLPKFQQDAALVTAGQRIAWDAAAVPDATLFMDNSVTPYEGKADMKSYATNPSFVWEHRAFTTLIDVINMISDNAQRDGSRMNFIRECNQFLNKLTPYTQIKTDEQVNEDKSLLDAYTVLKEQNKEYMALMIQKYRRGPGPK